MMMPKPAVQTTPGSVLSLRPTAPGSPLTITARVDGGVIGYKDLAAIPRDKAILEIERPDLMLYQPHYCYSPIERSLSPYSVSPPPSPDHMLKETRDWLDRRSGGGSSSPGSTNQSRTHSSMSTPTTPQTASTPTQTINKTPLQHFHRPDNGTNIYKKPPIYKQAASSPPQDKHMQELIIESSRFPSAQAPDPNLPSAIETESWPCPPSTAIIEQESRRRAQPPEEEEEEETDDFFQLRLRHSQQLSTIPGNMDARKPDPFLNVTQGPNPLNWLHPRPQDFPGSSQQSSDQQTRLLKNGDSRADSRASSHQLKVFPYSALVVTHRGRSTLPPQADRTQLERHLSEDEFYSVFRMTLEEFDQLSLWKRNELKKRVCLF
uniref:HP domain-containing protein n=1 Tax=Knipowitschia caucasica TaxID=637954 RepID=A0AAV2MQ45_KNICA